MTAADGAADAPPRDLFAQCVRDHARQFFGYPIAVLRAGCTASADDLGLDKLCAHGFEISVAAIDQDDSLTRAAVSAADTGRGTLPDKPAPGKPAQDGPAVYAPVLGDLRTAQLPPRSFDIVYCALLLERIAHTELVLDRFVAALKPGGLLLLRFRDRDSAAGFLDRALPEAARRLIWQRLRPAEPGPFPPVYEPLTSARGIQSFVLMRGLVVSQQQAARTLPRGPDRLSRGLAASRAVVSRLTRGRLTDAHDELLYVIRKPENWFARVV
jgi:SAM-dependent methyltransferase